MKLGDGLTRTELLRVLEEFKSERDAAKRDALRAFAERDALIHQLQNVARCSCRKVRDGV